MKKNLIAFMIAVSCSILLTAQNVGIGTNSPANSALLDLNSTTKGMLAPRMTTVQRTGILSPATGLLVFDTDTKTFWFYSGTAWTNITSASGGAGNLSFPFYTSVNVTDSAFHIKNAGANVGIAGESEQGAGLVGKSSTGSGIEGVSSNGSGVYAFSNTGSGVNALSANGFGIISNSINGTSIYGFSNNTLPTTKSSNNGSGSGVEAYSANGSGLYASSNNGAGINALSNNGMGVVATSTNGTAVYGFTTNTNPAIKGTNSGGDGINGSSSAANKAGIRGEATGSGSNGVFGTTTATNGNGVYGYNTAGVGVLGSSNTGHGISAFSNSGVGLRAASTTGTAMEVFGNLKIYGGNTNPSNGAVLTSDALGNAHWDTRVAFRVYGISNALTNTVENNKFEDAVTKKVEFLTKSYDLTNSISITGNNSSTATSSCFIVPKKGIYHFDAALTNTIELASLLSNFDEMRIALMMERNGSNYVLAFNFQRPANALGGTISLSTDVSLLPGDRVWLEFRHINVLGDFKMLSTSGSENYFSGHLVIPQ